VSGAPCGQLKTAIINTDIVVQESQGDMEPGSVHSPEAERKFQVWRATTTGLLLESMDTEEAPERYNIAQERKGKMIHRICETIDPFLRSHDNGYPQDLLQILDDATALDMEISKQVARVEWMFPKMGVKTMYDPATMELEKGEKPSKSQQEVLLAVSPAMKKRGKSTGEDFKAESLLLPMEVSCEPVVDQNM